MEVDVRRIVFALVVACLLVGTGWVAGQQTTQFQVPIDPHILSGPDIGFRVEGRARQGDVVGTLMVRLKNGEWVRALPNPSQGRVIPLDTK